MKKLIIHAIATAILCTGCARTTDIKSNLDYRTDELTYADLSKPLVEKKGGTLAIGSFIVEDVLPPDARVVKKSGFVVPLLVLNFWHYEYQTNLGYDRIANDYKEFMRESFIREIKQGCVLAYDEKHGDFTADVTIHKVEISAPVTQFGTFIFLFPLDIIPHWNDNFKLGPLDVEIQADVVFKHDGIVVSNKNVHGKYVKDIYDEVSPPYFERRKEDDGILIQAYTLIMIDGFSSAVRDLNENIVGMINHEAELINQNK